MMWSEVTHYHEAEGRPQVASEDARTQRMKHRELQSPGVGALIAPNATAPRHPRRWSF